MTNQCSTCSSTISLSWFILSFHWTKYVCPNCGTLFEWTKKRKILGGIIGGLSGITSISILLYLNHLASIKSIYKEIILGMLLFSIIILSLLLIQLLVSGQLCKSKKQPFFKSEEL